MLFINQVRNFLQYDTSLLCFEFTKEPIFLTQEEISNSSFPPPNLYKKSLLLTGHSRIFAGNNDLCKNPELLLFSNITIFLKHGRNLEEKEDFVRNPLKKLYNEILSRIIIYKKILADKQSNIVKVEEDYQFFF